MSVDRDSFVLNSILDGQTITGVAKSIGVCTSAAREILHRQVKTVMPELYGQRRTRNISYPELQELRHLKDEIKLKIIERLELIKPKIYTEGNKNISDAMLLLVNAGYTVSKQVKEGK